jgi:CDP-diacylglycerol--glycerol-3-phosphate 3-phosphatidyltransferase
MEGRLWTLSNGLSFLRVLLVIPIAVLLWKNTSPYQEYAAILIVIASATDLFDGILARKLNQVTDLGKIIDPLADKIGIGAVAFILTLQGKLPVWFVVAVLARDVLIFLGGMYAKNKKGVLLQSNLPGKWAAATTALFILVTVIESAVLTEVRTVLLIASVCIMALSFILYSKRFISLFSN